MQVEVVGEGGRRLVLAELVGSEDGVRYVATLVTELGEGSVTVWEDRSTLAIFFRDLADHWQGFDGTPEYVSTEGQLALRCTHDGLGSVECDVTLRQPWPPTWSTSAVLILGSGAHLAAVARDIEAFFAADV